MYYLSFWESNGTRKLKAYFWSGETPLKFLSDFMTYSSSLPYSNQPLNHGWPSACWAVNLLAGSLISNLLTMSFTSALCSFHCGSSIEYEASSTFSRSSYGLDPLNGVCPVTKRYRMTPNDHISHSFEYSPVKTSGAT